MPVHLTRRVAALSLAALLSTAALAGCGSSTSSSGFGPRGPGGFAQDPALVKKIQKCLKAAGLATSLPSGRFSGRPSGPSGYPSSPPSAFPSDRPTGRFSGGPGGGFGNPKVQQALEACGIDFTRPS